MAKNRRWQSTSPSATCPSINEGPSERPSLETYIRPFCTLYFSRLTLTREHFLTEIEMAIRWQQRHSEHVAMHDRSNTHRSITSWHCQFRNPMAVVALPVPNNIASVEEKPSVYCMYCILEGFLRHKTSLIPNISTPKYIAPEGGLGTRHRD